MKLRKLFRKWRKTSYDLNDKKAKKKDDEFSNSDCWNSYQSMKVSQSLPCLVPGFVHETDSSKYKEGVHWNKEQVLGSGQFGICYQAIDVVTGTLMAVKKVPILGPFAEREKASLREEIQLLARLHHPNIVHIMGATEEINTHFNIFMEWMPGGSVASLYAKFGSFHELVIIRYIKQVLTGLAYLHDNKILHRDLKGSNLLVSGSGKYLKISDFGAAGCLRTHKTAQGEFEGQVAGTIPFMAPEVIRGESYGRSSDIWSVGCVIIEMATATLPWNATEVENHFQLMYKIARTTEPPFVPVFLSNSIRNLAYKCLKVDRQKRLSAKELLTHTVFSQATVATTTGLESVNYKSTGSATASSISSDDDRMYVFPRRRQSDSSCPDSLSIMDEVFESESSQLGFIAEESADI